MRREISGKGPNTHDRHDDRPVSEPQSPAELEPAPILTGSAGVAEYWRKGCWREYGYLGWNSVLDYLAGHGHVLYASPGHQRHLRKLAAQ